MSQTIIIPQDLPQFTDEKALLIVAAKQEGRIYTAGNGEMNLVEEFRIPTPHFSDNETAPQARGKQENLGEEKIHHFAPQHVQDELKEILHPLFSNARVTSIMGIFTKESTDELLKRISA